MFKTMPISEVKTRLLKLVSGVGTAKMRLLLRVMENPRLF